jgi:hypothetical protein
MMCLVFFCDAVESNLQIQKNECGFASKGSGSFSDVTQPPEDWTGGKDNYKKGWTDTKKLP